MILEIPDDVAGVEVDPDYRGFACPVCTHEAHFIAGGHHGEVVKVMRPFYSLYVCDCGHHFSTIESEIEGDENDFEDDED